MRATSLLLLFLIDLNKAREKDEARDWSRTKQAEREVYEWVLNRTSVLYIPPNIRYNRTVFINVDLFQVMEVDERKGMVEVKLSLDLVYYLYGLDWTHVFPNCASTELVVPRGTVWRPDLVFSNSIDVMGSWHHQSVGSDGRVVAFQDSLTVQYSCSFKMRNFPFL